MSAMNRVYAFKFEMHAVCLGRSQIDHEQVRKYKWSKVISAATAAVEETQIYIITDKLKSIIYY